MRKRKSNKYYRVGRIFLAIWIVFTVLIKVVDVQPIGPEGSKVGFAKLNGAFFEMTGFNETLYNLTETVGILTFAVIAFFASIGAYQLFARRSLFKVDKRIMALGFFYISVGIFYLLFRVVVINYRPVMLDGGLEASYPSSHTMMAISVFLSAIIMIHEMVPKERLKHILIAACIVVLFVLAGGRALCGIHWITDIVAGTLLSLGLLFIFKGVIERQKEATRGLKLY